MADILLIETATEVCSAGIARDGLVLSLAEDRSPLSHAARLTLLIQQCTQQAGLQLADLHAVAISRGPGSYTSLRIGASVAKGICYALDKPLIAVDTLMALADASWNEAHAAGVDQAQPLFALPMLDARRNEVWAAVYAPDLRLLVPEQPLIVEHNLFLNFVAQNAVHQPDSRYILSGSGSKKMENANFFEQAVFYATQFSSAAHLARLAATKFQQADFQGISRFEPWYMKPPNITVSSKRFF